MQMLLTFLKANTSQKNGKTYVELVNKHTYAKTLHQLSGSASVQGLKQGDEILVTFELNGDGFKHILDIVDIAK